MPRRKSGLSLDQRAARPIADDNPDVEYLRLSRQEICRTEINAAVRLFLIDEDPISAHLLASAATEIMVVLSEGRSGVGLNDIRARMKSDAFSSDESDELFQTLQHPYNFLKHGSSDFGVTNDFSVDYIVATIYIAVHSYKLLFDDLPTEMMLFYGIVRSWRIDWWKDTPGSEETRPLADKVGLVGASRKEVCEFGRELLRKARG